MLSTARRKPSKPPLSERYVDKRSNHFKTGAFPKCKPGAEREKMPIHTHDFVETYQGLVGYGADRETDENTVIYYLQKFSDDRFMAMVTKRMTDAELLEMFEFINRLLKNHLTDSEYHQLFLKDDG